MPERPEDDGFDWLFGSREKPASTADPEPTQVIPLRSSPPGAAYPGAPGRQAPSEPRAARPTVAGQPPVYGTDQPTAYQPPLRQPPPRQTPPGATARPTDPPARRRRWLWVLLVIAVAWVVFLVAVPIWAWSKIDKVDAAPAGNRPADTPGTTYLLVGSDSRAGLTPEQRQQLATGDAAGKRTDTIMLLHVPDGSGPTLLLSIPRDSYVGIPGHGQDKINAAFSYGGPKLLVRTVEQATGLRVDDYIEIGFGGFVSIVDAVGGVRICPKSAMKDPRANLDLAKGCQQADGPTALGYVRSRYTDPLGDIGRAARQREVVGAVAGKAASPLTVLLPWRYLSLAGSGADAVRIGADVGPLELAKFAWAVAHVGESGLTCAVPIADAGAIINGISYVVWKAPAAKRLFKAIAEDRTDAANCSARG